MTLTRPEFSWLSWLSANTLMVNRNNRTKIKSFMVFRVAFTIVSVFSTTFPSALCHVFNRSPVVNHSSWNGNIFFSIFFSISKETRNPRWRNLKFNFSDKLSYFSPATYFIFYKNVLVVRFLIKKNHLMTCFHSFFRVPRNISAELCYFDFLPYFFAITLPV